MIKHALLYMMVAATTSPAAAEAPSRPNVLFIAVDDWNDWVGSFGGNQAKTPNLDRLAARGVAFRNAHASAVYCAPSRTSVMTGRNPHTTGFYHDQPFFSAAHDPQLKDVALWFRENGYHTAGGGKIYHHMPGFIDMRGWSEYFHWSNEKKANAWSLDSWGSGAPLPPEIPASPFAKLTYQEALNKNSKKPPKKLNSHMEWGSLANDQEEQMADTICTEWAANFIKKYKAEKPFFLGFGLYAPHKPNFVPQKYVDLYPLSEVKLPESFADDLDDLPPILRKKTEGRRRHVDDKVRKLNCAKEAVQGYLAALSYADAMVGRLLDALDESKRSSDTIVVLWSDNGYHLGEKGCWAKHTLWERTSNVPFIWAGPKIAKGAVVDTTVSLLDVYPTLLDACGLPKNPRAQGVSLLRTLTNPSSAVDRTVMQNDAENFALINAEWRYVRTTGGEEQLYHVTNDPAERHNLADKPEYKGKLAEFAALIPSELAKPGLRPKDKQLILTKSGNSFKWKERR